RDRVHHVGDEDHGPDLAGVAARLRALGDDDVDARLDVPERVLDAAAEGRDLDAARVHLIDHVPGRRAERVHEQPDRVRERDLDLRAGAGVRPGEESVRVIVVSEANEPGSESGKRSDDRRGVPEGTPQEGGATTPLAAPGSFAAAAMITRMAS